MSRDGLALHAVGQTDIGLKRKRNEDFHQFAIPSPGSLQEKRGALFIVADGMGAMGGGDVASRTAVTEILRHFYDPACIEQESFNCLKDALELANGAVRDQAQQVNLPRIGTTAAGLAVLPSGDALVFNVGDSRVYRVRQGLIEQLSHDQSVLQNQLDAGHITPEQARGARNVNVTAFIGQPFPLSAVYRRVQVQSGDSFLLCSDGLWDLVEPREVLNIMQRYAPAAAAQKLINLARKRGGPDNITVIIVEAGKVPHGSKKLVAALAVLGVLILALVAGGLFLLTRDESGEATATRGASAVLAETEEAMEVMSSPTQQQAILSYMTLTPTPSYTPSITPSRLPATDTPIPTVTHTPYPTDTATVKPTTTPTEMPTDTLTPSPSATPLSPTPTWTPRPTRTQTSTPTVTPTRQPTDTPMRQPTVTLNPTLVTFTPTVPPTATPTLTAVEQNLQFAIEDGVALQTDTTLVILPAMGDAQTILLPQGTEVKLLGEETRLNPGNAQDSLRQVRVINGVYEDKVGWLPQSAIEMAEPIVPRIVVKSGLEQGANVRRGDSMSYSVVGMLRSGESAPIVGISSTGSGWYLIELDNGQQGWIAPGVVIVTGRLDRVPSRIPPPSPTPSLTPTVTVPAAISTEEVTQE